MASERDKRFEQEPVSTRLETILERALRAYQRGELHGGAAWIGERILDDELTPIAREAFLHADDLPSDDEVLRVLGTEPMHLLGEGYHMMALVEPARRFVAKYAKHLTPIPPLAPPAQQSPGEGWSQDWGVRPDGTLQPAVWQYVRAFEAYEPMGVPSRVYVADSALPGLSVDERRAMERFRSIGIVRSLGATPLVVRIRYPDDFPHGKRAPEGVTLSVLVVQPLATPLGAAIERALRAGDVQAARDLEARYEEFLDQLWGCGVSHLDFSILNIGIVGSGPTERLQIFDPHMGVIEVADGAGEARDPLSSSSSGVRSLDTVLRSSRDGSRWALWRVQQDVAASDEVPRGGTAAAEEVVRDFHVASEGIEHGEGTFGRERFDRTWQKQPTHALNTVLHAQLWKLLRHPLGALVRSVLDPTARDAVYDRALDVLGLDDERPLAQFRAGLKVHEDRPLFLIANVSDDGPRLAKHWGRLRLTPELDVQDDPAIHYHLRDLLTGEMYIRSGDELVQRGFVFALAPYELHALQMEDVTVDDRAVERTLAGQRDISAFLKDCTKRVGVVGDVHGELVALQEIVRALGFIDSAGNWFARDGALVFTGDVGHGRHLQEVFDFIHRLAHQAHRLGGRIVWTLGNHDLYMDREGGQGGVESVGYRLWPTIREAALHPERHPGLLVQAVYYDHDKLFVHGGILPNIVDLAMREWGAGDPASVAAYVNDVFRRTLLDRERIMARDLPHEIFRIGTSHTREPRLPGEVGYEPAGVFTPDLRELDHYRYHAALLPQVVGHTASRRGEIRYSPGSWRRRDYIAIDVGRQHGAGNGGLLLTDFGWVAVTPGGPANLIEVGPLFARLAHETGGGARAEEDGEASVTRMLTTYFHLTRSERRSHRNLQQGLFAELSPPQVVALERFLETTRQTGECVITTDLDEMLTAFTGGDLEEDTVDTIAEYVAAGGILVFSTASSFEWFYARLLRPLIVELGARSHRLAHVLLILSGGREIFVYQDGAYRRMPGSAGQDSGFDSLVRLSTSGQVSGMPALDMKRAMYIGGTFTPGGIDHAMAERVGIVINVGQAMLETPDKPIINLHRGYRRTIDVMAAATAALQESGREPSPASSPDAGDTALWTFERQDVPPGRRLCVRVGGSGFVHAGVSQGHGVWDPVYNVALVPRPEGGYEAVLPPGVDAFTFFWTEQPWRSGLPGHWEPGPRGGRVFRVPTA